MKFVFSIFTASNKYSSTVATLVQNSWRNLANFDSPLVNQHNYWNKPIHSSLTDLLKHVIFHSYVSLPEGTWVFLHSTRLPQSEVSQSRSTAAAARLRWEKSGGRLVAPFLIFCSLGRWHQPLKEHMMLDSISVSSWLGLDILRYLVKTTNRIGFTLW